MLPRDERDLSAVLTDLVKRGTDSSCLTIRCSHGFPSTTSGHVSQLFSATTKYVLPSLDFHHDPRRSLCPQPAVISNRAQNVTNRLRAFIKEHATAELRENHRQP